MPAALITVAERVSMLYGWLETSGAISTLLQFFFACKYSCVLRNMGKYKTTFNGGGTKKEESLSDGLASQIWTNYSMTMSGVLPGRIMRAILC